MKIKNSKIRKGATLLGIMNCLKSRLTLASTLHQKQFLIFNSKFLISLVCLALAACVTLGDPITAARQEAMNDAIRAETPGDYFIGRRMFKKNYKVWGWVRRPQQSWKDSQLVMFNEQKTLAPDRARNAIGTDNNYEYRLHGYFSGEKVYEPASNIIFPEFVLTGYELRSKNPPDIYSRPIQNQPEANIFMPPVH